MKKIIAALFITGLLLASSPLQSNARPADKCPSYAVANVEAGKAGNLLLRLDEIRRMDKSGLSAAARTDLRAEIQSIHKQLEAPDGGIYLSAGALILILILLIILL